MAIEVQPATVLLTPAQVAAHLNVPVTRLYRWRLREEGPAYTKVGRAIRYPKDLFEKWLRSRTVIVPRHSAA